MRFDFRLQPTTGALRFVQAGFAADHPAQRDTEAAYTLPV